jgi:hypothetical protein
MERLVGLVAKCGGQVLEVIIRGKVLRRICRGRNTNRRGTRWREARKSLLRSQRELDPSARELQWLVENVKALREQQGPLGVRYVVSEENVEYRLEDYEEVWREK